MTLVKRDYLSRADTSVISFLELFVYGPAFIFCLCTMLMDGYFPLSGPLLLKNLENTVLDSLTYEF